jgi:uncharacterized protein
MSEPLFDAIDAGDVTRLADLLAEGANPNVFFQSRYGVSVGLTPLQVAVWRLDDEPSRPLDAVVLLLRYGAAVNAWDEKHATTALLNAAMINHMQAARVLLAAGAEPNVLNDEGYSPLRYCAQEGFLEMAGLLLRSGATKTIDEWGGPGALTALGFAARGLHVEMVKLLLAHGADPQGQNVDGMTPLDYLQFADAPAADSAAQHRLSEIRRLLGGADPTAPASDHNGKDE